MYNGITYRKASCHDATYIGAIWNQGIDDGIATLEIEKRDTEWVKNWLSSRDPRYSVIIADDDGKIVGWLSLNPFSQRKVYRFVADISIYIERTHRGHGLGSNLLDQGILEARTNGFHKIVLTMISGNEHARNLYINHGFRTVGIMHEQGILNNKWIDTEIMEKIL
ncbi:MAG TPA: N-acetyltransferase [Ferroplasma sp.]|nr:N-acetyltransferase [Ferroplasma sp.]